MGGLCEKAVEGSGKPPRPSTCPSSSLSLPHSWSFTKKEAEYKAIRAAGNPWSQSAKGTPLSRQGQHVLATGAEP